MKKTIANLPSHFDYFTHEDFQIYSLDDCAVHLEPEIKECLLKKGYIYVGIGGGITGNDLVILDSLQSGGVTFLIQIASLRSGNIWYLEYF